MVLPKHEEFCQQYVTALGNLPKAAKNLGIKTELAKTWLKRQDVNDYIIQLRVLGQIKHGISREFLTEEYLLNLGHCKFERKRAETNKTVENLGKLHGLIIDKQDVNTNHNFQVMKDVTLDGEALTFDVGQGQRLDDDTLRLASGNSQSASSVDDLV